MDYKLCLSDIDTAERPIYLLYDNFQRRGRVRLPVLVNRIPRDSYDWSKDNRNGKEETAETVKI